MSSFNENTIQNSLTSPLDKDPSQPKSFNVRKTMTDSEAEAGFKELHVTNFPRFEKLYADPPLSNQLYSLISWVPAKGATPDADGVYGMLKSRGNFGSRQEADLYAENLIKNYDSYHCIYQSYVGQPFPLAKNKKYICETSEVDIKKKVMETNSGQIRQNRDEERDTIKQIEEKQKKLLEDVKEDKEEDPVELYTETSVKKAQLVWTYHNTLKKLEEMKQSIIKSRDLLKKMDVEHPECKEQYMERYMKARRDAALPDTDDSFIKYLGEDLDLGF